MKQEQGIRQVRSGGRTTYTVDGDHGFVIDQGARGFEAMWRIRMTSKTGLPVVVTSVAWKFFPTLGEAVAHIRTQTYVEPVL